AVGILAADGCNIFGVGCALAPTQLISANAAQGGNEVKVTKNDVRFIINAGQAQSTFGTPFGNTPRNVVQDDITNIANASIYKKVKITERTSFEFRTTFINVFNHPNFQSVDPFLEDAADNTFPFGFGNTKLTSSVPFFYQSNNTRIILFGGTLRF